MTDKSINIEKMIALFNHIAMKEGYNMIVNEIDPLQFFSTKQRFFDMIDKLIDYYIDLEEYEKCGELKKAKKNSRLKKKFINL